MANEPTISVPDARLDTPSQLSSFPSRSPAASVLSAAQLLGTDIFIGVCLWSGIIPKEDWKWAIGGMVLTTLPVDVIGGIVRTIARKLPGKS